MLERFPGAFQEDAVLWVHDLGFPRVHPKKSRVKQVRPLQQTARFDVIGIVLAINVAGGFQFGVVEERDAFNAAAEVAPEFLDVPCPWKTPGHPDNGDAGVMVGCAHGR